MTNLLVTGGAGFIGSNFVHYWTKHYPNDVLVVLDALTYAGNYHNIAALKKLPRFQFVRGNILDQRLVEDLLRSRQIDILVNFAAESHVDRSIFDPDLFVKTNIEGTHSLLAAARNVWLGGGKPERKVRFHHLSTIEVYGELDPSAPPFSESSPYAPSSPFAASKAASDHLVRSYFETYGLPVTISNSPNNFGRHHYPDKLVPLIIGRILRNKELPIYGDGEQIRDWLYVQEHCRGLDTVMRRGRIGETYHIGVGKEWTNIRMVTFICDAMDKFFKNSSAYRKKFPQAVSAAQGASRDLIRLVEDRPGHDRRCALDISKMREEFGWRPRYTFKGAMEYTVGWYLRHPDWLSAVQSDDFENWMNLNYAKRYDSGLSNTRCPAL